MKEDVCVDRSDLRDDASEGALRPDDLPVLRKEDDMTRRDEFLECPSAQVPSALREEGDGCMRITVGWDVAQEGVTDAREGVVPEHGVDSFGELGAAGLVDAAGVGPGPVESILLSFEEEVSNFGGEAVTGIRSRVGGSRTDDIVCGRVL